MKGNGWIELILWLCYIVPGLIYSIWRRSGEPSVCPTCKSETLKPYVESANTTAVVQRVEVECEWCAEKILASAKICKHCGREVVPKNVDEVKLEPVINNPETSPKNVKPKRKTSIFTWLVVGFFGIGFLGLLLDDPDTNSTGNKSKAPATAVKPKISPNPNVNTVQGYKNQNINEACGYLNNLGFNTRGYKNIYSDNYQCISDYIDIGSIKGAMLPNNIAYYVSGKKSAVNELKLVINVNQKATSDQAINKILTASKELTKKAVGIELPSEIISAIKTPKNANYKHNDINLQVIHDVWPNGNGFEVKYIIK
jgi:hypothetical protein